MAYNSKLGTYSDEDLVYDVKYVRIRAEIGTVMGGMTFGSSLDTHCLDLVSNH